MRTGRAFPRALAAVIVAALTVVGAACSSSSNAGGGFTLRQSQLQTTTTTAAPKPAYTTETATANGPELEVYAEKPAAAPAAAGLTPPRATPIAVGAVQPIPRLGFNSAGSRKTETGWAFSNPTYFGNPLTLVVTENDGDWLKVMVPARPNGQEGWVKASDVTLAEHQFHGELTLSDFTLRVWDGDQPVAETQVVIGKPNTPTPVGRLYIAEKIKQSNAGGAYGPWVLATSAYSEALDLFDGGLPVIAFHGTNQPGLIGSQASNGCIRMPNDVVTTLADTIPAGTPIDVKE